VTVSGPHRSRLDASMHSSCLFARASGPTEAQPCQRPPLNRLACNLEICHATVTHGTCCGHTHPAGLRCAPPLRLSRERCQLFNPHTLGWTTSRAIRCPARAPPPITDTHTRTPFETAPPIAPRKVDCRATRAPDLHRRHLRASSSSINHHWSRCLNSNGSWSTHIGTTMWCSLLRPSASFLVKLKRSV